MEKFPLDKATASEIPVDILKNSEFCFSELTKGINKAFNENRFPDTLKLSDIVLVFKKLYPTDKTNFRTVSVLPLLPKVFEKLCMINFMNMRRHFLISYFVVSVKLTQRNMHFSDFFRNGGKSLTRLEL